MNSSKTAFRKIFSRNSRNFGSINSKKRPWTFNRTKHLLLSLRCSKFLDIQCICLLRTCTWVIPCHHLTCIILSNTVCPCIGRSLLGTPIKGSLHNLESDRVLSLPFIHLIPVCNNIWPREKELPSMITITPRSEWRKIRAITMVTVTMRANPMRKSTLTKLCSSRNQWWNQRSPSKKFLSLQLPVQQLPMPRPL